MAFESFRRYLRARKVFWNVVRELEAYNDRDLHDMGIDRGDISHIARAAAQEA